MAVGEVGLDGLAVAVLVMAVGKRGNAFAMTQNHKIMERTVLDLLLKNLPATTRSAVGKLVKLYTII